MKRLLALAAVGLTAGTAILADATPASAQWHRGWHRGWHGRRGGWIHRRWGPRWRGGPAYYYGCPLRWRFDPYWGRYVRVRVCY